MPDNLPPFASAFSALPDYSIVALDGPDAGSFAQAQFANDISAVAPGHWQWNTWLTPKGRVIAVFALVKADEERILLVLPDAPALELAPQLQRFVFRRKLKVTVPAELQVAGAFQKPDLAESARIADDGMAIELDYGDDHQARTLRICAAGQPARRVGADELWFAQDLKAGLPRLPAPQREQWTPQQLSLERLHAFSVKKGCYPGQEIVARTHFLGKAKRGLALFRASASIVVGTEVSDGERALGSIISVSEGQTPLALAVLPLDRPAVALRAGEASLDETALQDGLAR